MAEIWYLEVGPPDSVTNERVKVARLFDLRNFVTDLRSKLAPLHFVYLA